MDKNLYSQIRLDDGKNTRKRLIGGGRKLSAAEFDEEVFEWVQELRSKKSRVTIPMIESYAIKTSLKFECLKDFKVSKF